MYNIFCTHKPYFLMLGHNSHYYTYLYVYVWCDHYDGMSFLISYCIEQAAELADHMPRGLKCPWNLTTNKQINT